MTDDEANFDPEKDNTAFFNEEIRPLMSKVLELCRARGIPFVALFQASSEMFSEHCSIPQGSSWLLYSIDSFIDECRAMGAALN